MTLNTRGGVRRRALVAILAVAVPLAGCAAPAERPAPAPTRSATAASAPTETAAAPGLMPGTCNEAAPCRLQQGTFHLQPDSVLSGLRLTIPSAGWSTPTNIPAELKLVPPGLQDATLIIWTEAVAAKSSGTGRGSALPGVRSDPASLLAWLDANPDLTVQKTPTRTIAGMRMPSRVVTPSPTVRFGDPECPSEPRCAAILTGSPDLWHEDFFAIGYPETAQLYVGGPVRDAQGLTVKNLIVALDAPDPDALARLEAVSRPLLDSMTRH